ncbi:MAG: hypothetical protein AB7I35_01400 [Ramlibacter sp.]
MGNQKAGKVDLRQQMPETAAWVNERRAEWGADHVNSCIKRGLAGEPDQFYAVEAGHVLGAPFATALHGEVVDLAVKYGAKSVRIMRAPANGTH